MKDFIKRVVEAQKRSAIKKKIGAQSIVGAGTTNTIKGIYNADTKVMPIIPFFSIIYAICSLVKFLG